MAELFVLCTSEDAKHSEPLRRKIEDSGHSVLFSGRMDRDDNYQSLFEASAESSDLILALYSEDSSSSPWFKSETQVATSLTKIVPVKFGKARLPLLQRFVRKYRCQNILEMREDDWLKLAEDILHSEKLSFGLSTTDEEKLTTFQPPKIKSLIAFASLGLLLIFFSAYLYLDDKAFNRAVETDTKQAYNEYLENWPFGGHRSEVKRRLRGEIFYAALIIGDTFDPFQAELLKKLTYSAPPPWEDISETDWQTLQSSALVRMATRGDGYDRLSRAALDGDAKAAALLGAGISLGMYGVEPDIPRGTALLQAACDEGENWACSLLGNFMTRWYPPHGNYEVGIKLAKPSCETGFSFHCASVDDSIAYSRDGPKDVDLASSSASKKCESGNRDSCSVLARFYYYGSGVESSMSKAREFSELGCNQGSLYGCEVLGDVYSFGIGSPRTPNHEQALKYYLRACHGTFRGACYRAGQYYRDGLGTKRSNSLAAEYFEEACNMGESRACNDWGVLKDSKYPKNHPEAFKAFSLACKGQNGTGCYNVGLYLEAGRTGVKKDIIQSKEYYERACQYEYQKACASEINIRLEHPEEFSISNKDSFQELEALCRDQNFYACIFVGDAHRDGLLEEPNITRARESYESALELATSSTEEESANTRIQLLEQSNN